jgi:predicted Zn-dependent peptidase
MEYKTNFLTLDNGIKVLLVPTKGTKLIDFMLSFRVGSDLEKTKPNTLEITHFLEHMFSGMTSNKYPDFYKLRESLVKNGCRIDASVDYTTTMYQIKCLKTELSRILDIAYHAYTDFKLDEKVLEQERNAIREEINTILNDQWINFIENSNKLFFPNHIRSISQHDHLKNVNHITSADIIKFFNHYYTPKNMLISIAGDFEIKKIMSLLNKTFGSITKLGKLNKFPSLTFKNDKRILFTKNTNSKSSNLYFTFRINLEFDNIQKYTIFSIGNLLTGGLGSRLYRRLRGKEGLLYSIGYDISISKINKKFSYFEINTQVLDKNLYKVIEILLEELHLFKKDGPTDIEMEKELNDNKVYYLSKHLNKNPIRELERYSNYLLWDKNPITLKQEEQFVSKLTKKDIKTMSKTLFNFRNLFIMYSGKQNIDIKIKKMLD